MTERGCEADFAVFSPRKFLGVPDGGILVFNRPFDRGKMELWPSPAHWWLKALDASILRRQFDLHGGDHGWFALFQESEASAPVGDFRMSELSQILLADCFDYDAIRQRRGVNYDTLAAELADVALFPTRPSTVAPLGFPIRVPGRDRTGEPLRS